MGGDGFDGGKVGDTREIYQTAGVEEKKMKINENPKVEKEVDMCTFLSKGISLKLKENGEDVILDKALYKEEPPTMEGTAEGRLRERGRTGVWEVFWRKEGEDRIKREVDKKEVERLNRLRESARDKEVEEKRRRQEEKSRIEEEMAAKERRDKLMVLDELKEQERAAEEQKNRVKLAELHRDRLEKAKKKKEEDRENEERAWVERVKALKKNLSSEDTIYRTEIDEYIRVVTKPWSFDFFRPQIKEPRACKCNLIGLKGYLNLIERCIHFDGSGSYQAFDLRLSHFTQKRINWNLWKNWFGEIHILIEQGRYFRFKLRVSEEGVAFFTESGSILVNTEEGRVGVRIGADGGIEVVYRGRLPGPVFFRYWYHNKPKDFYLGDVVMSELSWWCSWYL